MNKLERQHEIDRYRVATGKKRILEAADVNSAWDYTDSPLLPGRSGISFHERFKGLLPKGVDLKEYIEITLADKAGTAIGLELGGTASQLFKGFTPGFFEKSIGVSLHDYRRESVKGLDTVHKHSVIAGDILSEQTQQHVRDALGGRKADFIIESMIGGAHNLPREPFFLSTHANAWYQMLSEGGVMFANVPFGFMPVIHDWVDYINKNHGDTLYVQADIEGLNMKLHKFPGAPENLPVLHVRDVLKTQSFISPLHSREEEELE